MISSIHLPLPTAHTWAPSSGRWVNEIELAATLMIADLNAHGCQALPRLREAQAYAVRGTW